MLEVTKQTSDQSRQYMTTTPASTPKTLKRSVEHESNKSNSWHNFESQTLLFCYSKLLYKPVNHPSIKIQCFEDGNQIRRQNIEMHTLFLKENHSWTALEGNL
ncbi:hypothetical protein AMECASPLE_035224 [Ameca splendens]|uniref:Uncharacterized protein n=1 Tax=Ameca splendens TaxID=208324 RepID=A0ABV0Z7G7_9TELE